MAPKLTSVDISRLQACNPDLMKGLKRPELKHKMQEILKGSDLSVDEKSGEVVASEKAQKVRDVALQAEMVRMYIKAADGDYTLTLEEAKKFIQENEQMKGISAQSFLEEARSFVEKRWGPICDNLKQYSVEYPLQNLVDGLHVYNDGIYKEEFEQGRMAFSPLKSAINLPSWFGNVAIFGLTPLEKSPLKAWDYQLGRETGVEAGFLSGDNMAMERAYDDHLKRQVAIAALVEVLNKDLKEKGKESVAWNNLGQNAEAGAGKASAEKILTLLKNSGNIQVTVERLDASADADKPVKRSYPETISGTEAEAILREQLAFEDLFALLTTTDKDERYQRAITFAQQERAGTLGLGGGHAVHRTPWNLVTDEVNNFYYAKSLLDTVIREGKPEQQQVATDLLYNQIMASGENGGGSLTHHLLWAVTLGQVWPYRPMSDEEAMYVPERIMKIGAVMAFGPEVAGWGKAKVLAGGGKVGETLGAWRAAEETNALQKGILAAAWAGDKAWATLTVRPLRKAYMDWVTKGMESSSILSKGAKAIGAAGSGMDNLQKSIIGQAVIRSSAAWLVDDYLSPVTGNEAWGYKGVLNTTAAARVYTLDPLPPETAE